MLRALKVYGEQQFQKQEWHLMCIEEKLAVCLGCFKKRILDAANFRSEKYE